ncbi:hypothetical protein O9G_003485 [Rozella allomycis CSF55]|uniref:Uncharacterized protein n=1 Tax=Rozella allomycis (strain CSF55) TaxID=988480 RepID=A0A075B2W7_ROZAC|nr:hypothetical protein O9G_003485 [Rozella allomycis CSF55]|eukprot:EPZ35113.1 hypothetical protein O9G_003485 [Rozella allomycis CSF55]
MNLPETSRDFFKWLHSLRVNNGAATGSLRLLPNHIVDNNSIDTLRCFSLDFDSKLCNLINPVYNVQHFGKEQIRISDSIVALYPPYLTIKESFSIVLQIKFFFALPRSNIFDIIHSAAIQESKATLKDEKWTVNYHASNVNFIVHDIIQNERNGEVESDNEGTILEIEIESPLLTNTKTVTSSMNSKDNMSSKEQNEEFLICKQMNEVLKRENLNLRLQNEELKQKFKSIGNILKELGIIFES